MRLALLLIRRPIGLVILFAILATCILRLVIGESNSRFPYTVLAYLLVAPITLALRALAWKWVTRQITAAFEQEDALAVRALADAVDPYADDPAIRPLARALQLNLLSIEERHDELRAAYAGVDLSRLSPEQRAMQRNALAWATAHAGDPEQAISLAESALAEAPPTLPPANVALCRGTLGAALVLAHRPADAILELDKARAAGGTPRAQSIRAYYLGEAHRALRRPEEALAAYADAEREFPGSRWAQRARAAKSNVLAYR